MADFQTELNAHGQAVEAFLGAARAVPASRWGQARAPGKWSPGQVVEHLALAYDVNRGVLQGQAPPMSAPRWVRPLIRRSLLEPVLRRGRFIPGSKSPGAFRPGPVPAAPELLLNRLAATTSAFEAEAAALRSSTIDPPVFRTAAAYRFRAAADDPYPAPLQSTALGRWLTRACSRR
jgi:DinB superfamily